MKPTHDWPARMVAFAFSAVAITLFLLALAALAG